MIAIPVPARADASAYHAFDLGSEAGYFALVHPQEPRQPVEVFEADELSLSQALVCALVTHGVCEGDSGPILRWMPWSDDPAFDALALQPGEGVAVDAQVAGSRMAPARAEEGWGALLGWLLERESSLLARALREQIAPPPAAPSARRGAL